MSLRDEKLQVSAHHCHEPGLNVLCPLMEGERLIHISKQSSVLPRIFSLTVVLSISISHFTSATLDTEGYRALCTRPVDE